MKLNPTTGCGCCGECPWKVIVRGCARPVETTAPGPVFGTFAFNSQPFGLPPPPEDVLDPSLLPGATVNLRESEGGPILISGTTDAAGEVILDVAGHDYETLWLEVKRGDRYAAHGQEVSFICEGHDHETDPLETFVFLAPKPEFTCCLTLDQEPVRRDVIVTIDGVDYPYTLGGLIPWIQVDKEVGNCLTCEDETIEHPWHCEVGTGNTPVTFLLGCDTLGAGFTITQQYDRMTNCEAINFGDGCPPAYSPEIYPNFMGIPSCGGFAGVGCINDLTNMGVCWHGLEETYTEIPSAPLNITATFSSNAPISTVTVTEAPAT